MIVDGDIVHGFYNSAVSRIVEVNTLFSEKVPFLVMTEDTVMSSSFMCIPFRRAVCAMML